MRTQGFQSSDVGTQFTDTQQDKSNTELNLSNVGPAIAPNETVASMAADPT